MLTRLRGLLVPIVALSLAVGGLAYAAVDDDSTLDVVQETSDETSPTDVDENDDQGEEPAEAPDSDDEVIPDEGTGDDGIVDDGAAEAAPVDEEEKSHGRERSTEGCPEGFSGNHGQYVSGTEEHPRSEAAHSPCGKPVHESDHADNDSDDEASENPTPADSDD